MCSDCASFDLSVESLVSCYHPSLLHTLYSNSTSIFYPFSIDPTAEKKTMI